MARTSQVNEVNRLHAKQQKAAAKGVKMEKGTRVYNRCALCGRSRGYMRRFNTCRICFRELAQKGAIPGLKKSSW